MIEPPSIPGWYATPIDVFTVRGVVYEVSSSSRKYFRQDYRRMRQGGLIRPVARMYIRSFIGFKGCPVVADAFNN